MKYFGALPGAIIAILGCVVIGFGVKAEIGHANHGNLCHVLVGILILSMGSFLGTVSYLAPRYGTKVGRHYTFHNDSPMAFFIPVGILVIGLEGGLLYWFAR